MIPDTIVDEGFIITGENPPLIIGNGLFWFKPSTQSLYVSYGGSWLDITGGNQGTTIIVDAAEPANPTKGQPWMDTFNNVLKIWTGLNWIPCISIPNLAHTVDSTNDVDSVTPKAVFDYVQQLISQIGSVATSNGLVRYNANGKIPFSVLEIPISTPNDVNMGTSTNTFITPSVLERSQYLREPQVNSKIAAEILASEGKSAQARGQIASRVSANETLLATHQADLNALKSSSASHRLSDLLDVDVTTTAPTNTQILTYDAASGKWIPSDRPTGGGATQGIQDAPQDGKTYARKLGAWTAVQGSATHDLPAPASGNVYTVGDLNALIEDDNYRLPSVTVGQNTMTNLAILGLTNDPETKEAYLERISSSEFNLDTIKIFADDTRKHLQYILTISAGEIPSAELESKNSLKWDKMAYPVSDDYQHSSSDSVASTKAVYDLWQASLGKSGGVMLGNLDVGDHEFRVGGRQFIKHISGDEVEVGNDAYFATLVSKANPKIRINGTVYDVFTSLMPPTATQVGALSKTAPRLEGTLDLNGHSVTSGAGNVLRGESGTYVLGNSSTPIRIDTSATPHLKIGSSSFELYHEGNKPTLTELGAAPALPSNAVAGTKYVLTTTGWVASAGASSAASEIGNFWVEGHDFTSMPEPVFYQNGEIYLATQSGRALSAYGGINVTAGMAYWYEKGSWRPYSGKLSPTKPTILNASATASVGVTSANKDKMLLTREYLLTDGAFLSIDSSKQALFSTDSYSLGLKNGSTVRKALTSDSAKLTVGDIHAHTELASRDNPTVLVGANRYEIYHAGNPPTAASLGTLDKAQADKYYMPLTRTLMQLGGIEHRFPSAATSLSSSVNIDTLNTKDKCGWYYQSSSANATTAHGYPSIGVAGGLAVISTGAGIKQIYYPYNANYSFERIYRSNRWEAWASSYNSAHKPAISNSVTNTSSSTYASSAAAKTAMDRANAAYSLAGGKWSRVNATSTVIGAVKLSDSHSSSSNINGGYAATPAAVKAAFDRANTALNNANSALAGLGGKVSTSLTATTSRRGIVQLSSNLGSTSSSYAATIGAVKTAYDTATGRARKGHMEDVNMHVVSSLPSRPTANHVYFITG